VKPEPQALRERVHFKIVEGLTHHFLGDDDAAKEKITSVRTETEKQGFVGLVLELRLAMSQILPAAEGKAEMDAVVRDARAKSFDRIAKLADAIAEQR
jgi:hypothetical protein